MRFVDRAEITVRSGSGGRGCVSFRREKFVPKGGPDGGDGGRGGHVLIRASAKRLTLYDVRLKRRYLAQDGQPGMGQDRHGRAGQEVLIQVPVGTLVFETQAAGGRRLLADLDRPDKEEVLVFGGRGGKGNAHFKSSTLRSPRFAQPGEPGQERSLTLELKILADVGLLGRPNAGKSTLLGAISAARPKVAAYPFTTLTPQLGVLRSKTNQQLIWADIPGLIPGAHQGQGLGYAFLRHVERTRLLVHILSVEECPLDRPEQGFVKLNEELAQYDRRLLARPQFWVLNKVDLLSADEQQVLKAKFARAGKEVFFISALTGEQVQGLVRAVWSFFESIWEAGGRGARN